MANDNIPTTDGGLIALGKTVADQVTQNAAAWGFTPAEATQLHTENTAFATTVSNHQDATQKAKAATGTKKQKATGYRKLLRNTLARINSHPGTDNAVRAAVGLPPRKEGRSPVGAPTTRPVLRLENNAPREQTVVIRDAANANAAHKPKGAKLCQLWVKVDGPEPGDTSSCKRVTEVSKLKYVHTFDPADIGKTAYWLAHWLSPNGDQGPLSVVASARING